jgi:hypothetical protein
MTVRKSAERFLIVKKSLRMVMGKENQMYVWQVVKINRRICAACPGHVISCVQEVGLAVVSSTCCHNSRNLV